MTKWKITEHIEDNYVFGIAILFTTLILALIAMIIKMSML